MVMHVVVEFVVDVEFVLVVFVFVVAMHAVDVELALVAVVFVEFVLVVVVFVVAMHVVDVVVAMYILSVQLMRSDMILIAHFEDIWVLPGYSTVAHRRITLEGP